MQPLPIDDELVREIAYGLESKKPYRGSSEWNTLQQWNQIKGLDSSTRVPEASDSQESMGPLEESGEQLEFEEEAAVEPRRTRPEQPAEACVQEYLEEHEDPDLDFFTWEIAIAYGFTEVEAGELIRRIQTELHRDSGDTLETLTRCLPCMRHGADTRLIMNQAGDPWLSQLTLEQFVRNIIGELRRLSR